MINTNEINLNELLDNQQSKNLAEMTEKAAEKKIYSIIIERQVDQLEEILKIKASKKEKIKIENMAEAIRIMARLGYVSGSMVGIITNLIKVSEVLMDETYNKQFLKENGLVDMLKLRKVFPKAGLFPKTKGYAPIFTEGNSNVFAVETVQGRRLRLLKVTKQDIAIFVKQIEEAMDLTDEDLVAIGRDLEQIGRIMQELEIDSAKDATVKEGMKEITTFMSAYTCTLSSNKVVVTNNFSDVVENKKNGSKEEVQFSYEIADYLPLSKAYEYAEKQYNEYLAENPDASDDDKKAAKREFVNDAIDSSYIDDAAMELKAYKVKQQGVFLNKLVDMYENHSNMDIFKDYQVLDLDVEQTIVDKIKHMVIVACEMINSFFADNNYMKINIEERAAKLRNAIYTYGASLGVDPEDTFEIAIHAGWYKLNKAGKVYPVTSDFKYRYAAIAAMFTKELKWVINEDAMYQTLEVEVPEGFAAPIGTAFKVEDGCAEVVLEDGTEDYLFCDYDGIIILQMVEGAPRFVKYVDIHAYEEVEFVMFDKVCDLTQKSNVFLYNNTTDELKAKAVTSIVLKDTEGLTGKDLKLAETANGEKLKKCYSDWANAMNLSINRKTQFSVHGVKLNEKDEDIYLSLVRRQDGAARMMGRLGHDVKTKLLNQYDAMETMVTSKGAICFLG